MARVAFDVDDTLWKCRYNPRLDQIPDYDLIQVLRWHVLNRDEVYVWSAGGVDYAQTIMKKLGLDTIVVVIEKEPRQDFIDICYDDEKVDLAKVNIQVYREPIDETNLRKKDNLRNS